MNRYINPDSDGRFYGLQDIVEADCHDCAGCSQCCEGMGDTILLDPFDLYQIQKHGRVTFDHLMTHGMIALTMRGGMILPHILMTDDADCCPFLSDEGRCTIHAYRPGICRLFPLGRDFQGDELEYILLEKACASRERTGVQVGEWFDVEQVEAYHAFVRDWYDFRRQMGEVLAGAAEHQAQELSLRLMQNFFVACYDTEKDFYPQYENLVGRFRRAFAGMYRDESAQL